MTHNESRPAKLRGRAVRAGACCAALAAVAMLTASCSTTTVAAGTLKTTAQTQVTDGHAASDARQLCNGRHASLVRLRRLVVTLHALIPANAVGRAAGPWTVTSAAKMRSVQRALCALPKPRPGIYNCPADLGISYQLRYYGPHGVLPAVAADASGCQLVTGLGNATRWATESPGFWRTLARAIGVAHLSGAAFPTP
jgi:hypothetical protein